MNSGLLRLWTETKRSLQQARRKGNKVGVQIIVRRFVQAARALRQKAQQKAGQPSVHAVENESIRAYAKEEEDALRLLSGAWDARAAQVCVSPV